MDAWATTGDVALYTGLTATDAQVMQAQFVIELFADTTTVATKALLISAKNMRMLKMATAYQAGWITQHPDAFTNMDTTNLSQDQVAATWAHANAGILAPFAKRCLDRLSWKRIRPLRVRPAYGSAFPPRHMNLISAVMDDNDPRWTSSGGTA